MVNYVVTKDIRHMETEGVSFAGKAMFYTLFAYDTLVFIYFIY
jgi:hypothetical protein